MSSSDDVFAAQLAYNAKWADFAGCECLDDKADRTVEQYVGMCKAMDAEKRGPRTRGEVTAANAYAKHLKLCVARRGPRRT